MTRLVLVALALAAAPDVRPGSSRIDTAAYAKAEAHLRTGNAAYKSGNTKKARAAFAKALELVPGLPDALIGTGLLAIADQDYEKALANFEAARDGFADLGEARFALANERYRDAQRSMRDLTALLSNLQARRPRNSQEEQTLRVQILQIEARLRTLETVRPPTFSREFEAPGEVFFHIGNALFHLGRVQEAREAWETCAEKSPKFAMAYNNLAIVYFKEGRVEEAIASLDRAEKLGLRVNPQFRSDLEAAKASTP